MTDTAGADPAPAVPAPSHPPRQGRVVVYIAVLIAAAVPAAITAGTIEVHAVDPVPWWALPAFGLLLVAAEHLDIRFRIGTQVNAVNLLEATAVPLLVVFPAPAAVATVAAAQIAGGVWRRNAPIKVAFNAASWSLCAGLGGIVLNAGGGHLADWPARPDLVGAAGVVAAVTVMALVSHVLFAFVVAIANRQTPRQVVTALRSFLVSAWVLGWAGNAATGLLFVLAVVASPAAIFLFPVPLAAVHLAFRGWTAARADRARLGGMHRAAQALSAPIDPLDGMAEFLAEVAGAFDARGAALLLADGDGTTAAVHELVIGDVVRTRHARLDTDPFVAWALTRVVAVHASGRGVDGAAAAVSHAGYEDAIVAPIFDESGAGPARVQGALVVFDQHGIEADVTSERIMLETMAREASHVFAKGRLLVAVVDERRALADIVASTSDGIFAIDADGVIRAWNPAMAAITGIEASDALGRPNVFARLEPQGPDGAPVDLEHWATAGLPPTRIQISTGAGSRSLDCSYSATTGTDGGTPLVVVARDVTSIEVISHLREEYGRLAEAEAAHRLVVDQLQEALMPPRPRLLGTDMAVSYLASDPSAPTGGDLYDWQVLPSGDLHLAVVDVVGHGVDATKDAVNVTHAIRTLAVSGWPIEDLVARADAVIGALRPDVVATVALARYTPATGRLILASASHPPALVVSPSGAVRQVAAPGVAVGWPGAGTEHVVETHLEPGETLVLYTDGLVEATKNILDGMDALMGHSAALALADPRQMADELIVRALAGADRRDDSLVLVLRRMPVPTVNTWRTEPSPGSTAAVRRSVGDWLGRWVDDDDRFELELVVSELLANAIAAARSAVTVQATVAPDGVTLEVVDDGPGDTGLVHAGEDLPIHDAEGGRGLYIVRSLTDDMTILTTTEGTSVRCQRRWRVADNDFPSASGPLSIRRHD